MIEDSWALVFGKDDTGYVFSLHSLCTDPFGQSPREKAARQKEDYNASGKHLFTVYGSNIRGLQQAALQECEERGLTDEKLLVKIRDIIH